MSSTTAVITTTTQRTTRRRLVVVAILAVSVAVGVSSGYSGGRWEQQQHPQQHRRPLQPSDVGAKPTAHVQVRELRHPSPPPPSPPPPHSPPPSPPPDHRWWRTIDWPKFLHQSYRNYDMSDNFKKWSSAVKSVNPDWTYVFWTDEVSESSEASLYTPSKRVHEKKARGGCGAAERRDYHRIATPSRSRIIIAVMNRCAFILFCFLSPI